MSSTTIAMGSSIGAGGFEWDAEGHQKGPWSLEGARGDAVLSSTLISGVSAGVGSGLGVGGVYGSVFQSQLTGAMTTGLEYGKLREGHRSNYGAIMTSGSSALGGFFGTVASAYGSEIGKERQAQERRQQAIKEALDSGKTPEQILLEEAKQAQRNAETYMGRDIIAGFGRRFRDGFVSAIGGDVVAEVGERLGNLFGEGSFSLDSEIKTTYLAKMAKASPSEAEVIKHQMMESGMFTGNEIDAAMVANSNRNAKNIPGNKAGTYAMSFVSAQTGKKITNEEWLKALKAAGADMSRADYGNVSQADIDNAIISLGGDPNKPVDMSKVNTIFQQQTEWGSGYEARVRAAQPAVGDPYNMTIAATGQPGIGSGEQFVEKGWWQDKIDRFKNHLNDAARNPGTALRGMLAAMAGGMERALMGPIGALKSLGVPTPAALLEKWLTPQDQIGLYHETIDYSEDSMTAGEIVGGFAAGSGPLAAVRGLFTGIRGLFQAGYRGITSLVRGVIRTEAAALEKGAFYSIKDGIGGAPTTSPSGDLMARIGESEIGRRVVGLVKRGVVDLRISENQMVTSGLKGMNVPGTNVAKVYRYAHEGLDDLSATAVHESLHAAGVGGSQRAELLARVAELKHLGQKASYSILKEEIRFIRAHPAYNQMPHKIGAQSRYFPEWLF